MEDRLAPAVIDLTQLGSSGMVNGAIFSQFTNQHGGSGAFNSFVRLSTNASVEQGYNTNFRPVQFNENSSPSFTRAIQLGSVPMVVAPGGLAYYEFELDINQSSSPPSNLLSLDELRLYVTNASTTDPALLHGYNSSTHTLQDDAGQLYSPLYDLNPQSDVNYIKLDANLSAGSGAGDMLAFIPVSLLGTDPSQYVYLYSKFGVHYANTGGYEQWAAQPAATVGSISGLAFVDKNGNGALDSGEPGLAGVTVYLDANNNGMLDPGEVSTVTASDGTFSFTNLLPGTYHVREVVPNGYTQTAQINADVTLTAGQNATGVEFGDFQFGSLSGTVFQDLTGNGFSPDDPPLTAVPVTLDLFRGNTLVATTTTNNNGAYSFANLGPGTYTVTEVVPNGWYLTAAPAGTFTLQSGAVVSNANFDNFLVAELINNNATLEVFTTSAVGGSVTVAQPVANKTNVTFDGVVVGTFTTPSQNIQITGNANFTVDTTQVAATPVIIFDEPGNDTYLAGSSGTTLFEDAGGTDTVDVAGGTNTLDFSRTTFGITYNAGLNQGQQQQLDASGKNFISVTGVFQTVVGTPFNDTFTAALPVFNPTTHTITPGTTILSGMGQDTIVGSIGTTAQENGAGSQYTETLTPAAVAVLSQAMSVLGSSTSALTGFQSNVTVNGGSSTVNTSLLTNVALAGTQNTLTQALDPNAAEVLQTALTGFGGSVSNLGGFGGSISAAGGFNTINVSVLTNTSLAAGTNTFTQSLDANAVALLNSAITGFGSSSSSLGGFGNSLHNLGGFGGSLSVSGGFNAVTTSVFSNVTVTGGTNTYDQAIDPDAEKVLNQAISTIETSFGGSPGALGGFGATLNSLAGFGNTITASGGFNTVFSSILTTVNFTGGSNKYVQAIDPNSAVVLQNAITGFGNSLTTPGGFGNSVSNPGGFGNSITSGGGFNQVQTSLLTNVSLTGGNNLYVQGLDANATKVLNSALAAIQQAFGSTLTTPGGFGAAITNLGGFGNSLTTAGGFNQVASSLLTTVTLGGTNNTYIQTLDANSAALLDQALTSFGASVGNAGGFGNSLKSLGGFGNSLTTGGGFNQVETSLLSTVTLNGTNNLYVQTLDANSEAVLNQAILDFGSSLGNAGGFGNSLTNPGGFGNSVSLPGGFSTAYTSLLTNVAAGGGNNILNQALDANSVSVLNNALAVLSTAGASVANIAGFGNTLGATGGYNNGQVGLLTTLSLSGGFDNVVETLDQNAIAVAATALGDATSAGSAAANAVAAAIGLQATLGDGDDVVVGGLLGTFTVGNGNDRIVIEDSGLLGASSVPAVLLAYGGTFTAGAGSNTFYLVGKGTFGSVNVNEPAGNSDTLDLSSLQVGGLHIDLSTTAPQQVLPGQLALTLSAPAGFGTVIGNGNAATLKAGSRAVTLEGAAPVDARGLNAPAPQGQTQVVYLDFVDYNPPGDHVYTSDEQAAILQRMVQAYEPFDFSFTTTQPTSGLYTTIFFNKTPAGGEAGGDSSEIDWRNLNLADTADVDVNGLLGGPGEPAATSGPTGNYVALSADIAEHELGHDVGLRHSDSFGPIGFGIHNPPGVNSFRPAYPGAQAAWETPDNIMASPASVGSSLFNAVGNTYFGERDLIKLAFIEDGTVVNEQAAAHSSIATAQPLTLAPLAVPDTEPTGFDAGKVFSVDAIDVANASIQLDSNTGLSQSDYYSFSGHAGDLMTFQTMSSALARIPDPVDTVLNIYDSSGNLLTTSDDDFEVSDSLITDFTLPATGTYYVQVTSYKNTEVGQYELFMYRFSAGNATPQGGSNDVFIAGPGTTTVLGRGAYDTIEDAGASNYTLTDALLTGSGSTTLQNVHNAILTGSPGGTTFNVSGWTGSAELIGIGGNNTVVVNRATNFTLSANTLTLADGGTFQLVDIQNVLLTGGPSGSTFDVGGWNGSATLTGVGGINTVVASRSANFILTDSSLNISGGGSFALVNVHNAMLTGATSGSTFDLRGWSGSATLNSQGGANPVVTPRGSPIAAQEGPATMVVGTFTDAGATVATDYAGTVAWGDGSSSAASFGASGALVTVTGNNLYREEGNYTVTTTINQGSAFSVIVSSTAQVADARLTNVHVNTVTATEGISTGNIAVATFVDPAGSEPLNEYAAVLNWGDGGVVTGGAIVDDGNGQFSVTAAHTYNEEGNYLLTVSITHNQLPAVSASGNIPVSDAPLTATAVTSLSPAEGIALNGVTVANFVDTNPLGKLSDFTASINWGDGTSSAGTVSQPGGTGTAFAVAGSHTYAAGATDTVTVTINDVGGQSAVTSFVVTVAPSIFVLDPTASGALTVTGSVAVAVRGAVVVDSNSSSALSASGGSQITASQIRVTGGVSASNNTTLTPTPTTGVPALPDPLAGLPAPSGSLPDRGSVNLTSGSETLQPGTYSQISASGKNTVLTLSPGIYVIKGGGLSVSNSASINGTSVLIYNAGSNFPGSGGTFGTISLTGSGTFALAAATSGTYAGVLLFQSRDNTEAVSLTANAAVGFVGTLYAPAAQLVISGSGKLLTGAIVDELKFSGNGGGPLTAAGFPTSPDTDVGRLITHNLSVYVDDSSRAFTATELARIRDAILNVDAVVMPHGVTITEVKSPNAASVVIDAGATTPGGGKQQGILGWFDPSTPGEEITIVTGWNWYAGANPVGIGAYQYDFETAVIHELGHALGLEHSQNPASAMFATLAPGVSHRTILESDLNLPAVGLGDIGLHLSNMSDKQSLLSSLFETGSQELSALLKAEQGMFHKEPGFWMTAELRMPFVSFSTGGISNSVENARTDPADADWWSALSRSASAHKMYVRQLSAQDAVFTELGREDGGDTST